MNTTEMPPHRARDASLHWRRLSPAPIATAGGSPASTLPATTVVAPVLVPTVEIIPPPELQVIASATAVCLFAPASPAVTRSRSRSSMRIYLAATAISLAIARARPPPVPLVTPRGRSAPTFLAAWLRHSSQCRLRRRRRRLAAQV